MSLTICNGTYRQWYIAMNNAVDAAEKLAESLGGDALAVQDAGYEAWKIWDQKRPEEATCFGMGEGTAQWLYEQCDGLFFFPEEGLTEAARLPLVCKLKELLERERSADACFQDPMLDTFSALVGGLSANGSVQFYNCAPPIAIKLEQLIDYLESEFEPIF